jgi:hypothetical protein
MRELRPRLDEHVCVEISVDLLRRLMRSTDRSGRSELRASGQQTVVEAIDVRCGRPGHS